MSKFRRISTESRRRWKGGEKSGTEWTSEGERKWPVPEYARRRRRSVINRPRMTVRKKWAQKASSRVAPQDYSILSQHDLLGQDFFCPDNEKGAIPMAQNIPLQNLSGRIRDADGMV